MWNLSLNMLGSYIYTTLSKAQRVSLPHHNSHVKRKKVFDFFKLPKKGKEVFQIYLIIKRHLISKGMSLIFDFHKATPRLMNIYIFSIVLKIYRQPEIFSKVRRETLSD